MTDWMGLTPWLVLLLVFPLALVGKRAALRRAALAVVGMFFVVDAALHPERVYRSLLFALLAFALFSGMVLRRGPAEQGGGEGR
jgi:hypothetical protein